MLCEQKAAGSSPAISIFPAVSGELAAMAIVDRSSDQTVIESSPQIATPTPPVPGRPAHSIPRRSRDEQPTSAFSPSHDRTGPLARGTRRRGADRPRSQPAEHQGLRYRRRRDDDPAATAVDEFAPDQRRRADELLSPAHPPTQPRAQRGD